MISNNEIKNYVIVLYNKTFIVKKFKTIIINNISYIFIGFITENDLIPKINCIYINNDNKCILHTINKPKIQFEVEGIPKGKARPRFRRFGNFVTTYTDKNTLNAENNISNVFKNMKNLPEIADNTSVHMEILCHMPIPSSISKKKQEELKNTLHQKKPDLDNLSKTVLDALNKLAYTDDSLISSLYCEKRYSEFPKTIIKINY